MVTFSCDGDSDISTDFSSSAPSSSSSSSINININSNEESSSSEQQLQKVPLKKAVTFSEVKVWEFETCVGDNPALSSGGCPVALSNKHTRTSSMPVEKAEALRESHHLNHRRSLEELMLDRESREERLLASGCTRKDIAAGVRKARKERRARIHSNRNREWDKVHEVVETVRRRLTKPFRASNSTSAALRPPVPSR